MKKFEVIKYLHETIDHADDQLLKKLYTVSTNHRKNNQLFRLIYSSARKDNCTEKDVLQILESSRKNNSKLGVTGMLVHTKSRFLQILEGPHQNILELYDKIKKDDRHHGSVMRFCEPIKKRIFPDWEMAYKDANNDGMQFLTTLTDEQKTDYNNLINGTTELYSDDSLNVLKAFVQYSA